MSVHVTGRHLALARGFVDKTSGGATGLDIGKFWAVQQEAIAKPFSSECPQMPLGIMMSPECVFAELGLAEDWYRLAHDPAYASGLAKSYNNLSQEIVGRRLLDESVPSFKWPETKTLADIFESRNVWHDASYWLMQAANDEESLARLLDRVDKRLDNLASFMLPPGWDSEKERLLAAGAQMPLYRGQRGPVTFAMSVFGVENLIFLITDNPELAARFRDTIIRAMLERARILDEEAGFTAETAPHGFYWCDDNCALLNAEMYDFFGAPVLKAVFDRYAPDPSDMRGQHSDSDMGHHLPVLGGLKLTTVNFGPRLTVSSIREHLPGAVIVGQLAPFTFSRNESVNMIAELLRDIEMAREHKGVIFATAGSINNGSRLSGMRLIMAAIQEFGWLS